MLVKHYGLFDGISKEFIRVLTSKNDDTAKRACQYIVREPDFDKISGKDYVLIHVYDFDSETGSVSNNDCRTIMPLATCIAELELELVKDCVLKGESTYGDSKNSEKGNN